jgi:hypothetical protein
VNVAATSPPVPSGASASGGPLFPRRLAIRLCWAALLLAPCLIIAGHFGTDIPWRKAHISWYAAKAPLGDLVTGAMALSTVAILCVARLLPGALRPRWWAYCLSLLMTLGSAGLVTLAIYEVDEARRIHNLGLVAFFFTTTPAMILAGLTAALNRRPTRERLAGLFAALTTATGVAVYVMWRLIPLDRGVRQRVAFTLIWAAALCLCWLLSPRDVTGHEETSRSPETTLT